MFEEKLALITGATSGIGKAFAEKYASKGYNLIITGRRENIINEVSKNIRGKYKVKVDTIIVDLSYDKGIDYLIENVKGKHISVLINNAGFGIYDFFYKENLSEFERMVNLHVMCTMKLVYVLLPEMMRKNEGVIINVSSEGAFLIAPKNSVYSGTKAFVKLFTEGLYLDLKKYNIKIQSLCPSLTRTDFHEKIGIDKSIQVNKGIMQWEEAEDVVKKSLKCLEKDKAVCLCGGIITRALMLIEFILPQKSYYNLICKLFYKYDE